MDSTRRAQIDRLDSELATTEAQLATAIGQALAEAGGVSRDEARIVGRIRKAHPEYLSVRGRLLQQVGRSGSPPLAMLDAQLDLVASRLVGQLAAYADAQVKEGGEALAALRSARKSDELLALLLGFVLLSLLATVWVARGIVVRVRAYAEFAAHVAEGDLGARLDSRRRDELGMLAASLNTMVEQLKSSSNQRRESLAEDAGYRSSQEAFSELLQVSESEREAHSILKQHIERGVPGTEVVVLNRNNSHDRLEATTTRPFESGGASPSLLDCEICGGTASASTCLPLLVSGEVIGSVLVDHEGALDGRDERRVHDSVGQAAPVLANLRNPALAEARALTDALTGLPNRRAVQDTLKRMIAQSARTASPLAAVLIDLDHFKQVNDTFGHDEGDAVLAAVADVLASLMRRATSRAATVARSSSPCSPTPTPRARWRRPRSCAPRSPRSSFRASSARSPQASG